MSTNTVGAEQGYSPADPDMDRVPSDAELAQRKLDAADSDAYVEYVMANATRYTDAAIGAMAAHRAYRDTSAEAAAPYNSDLRMSDRLRDTNSKLLAALAARDEARDMYLTSPHPDVTAEFTAIEIPDEESVPQDVPVPRPAANTFAVERKEYAQPAIPGVAKYLRIVAANVEAPDLFGSIEAKLPKGAPTRQEVAAEYAAEELAADQQAEKARTEVKRSLARKAIDFFALPDAWRIKLINRREAGRARAERRAEMSER